MPKRMKKVAKQIVGRLPANKEGAPALNVGFQWGEPPMRKTSLLVKRIEDELEIVGAMPQYASDHSGFDLLSEYQTSRSKSPATRNPPHTLFANAGSDDDLIQFVRTFGPVVCTECKLLPRNFTMEGMTSVYEPFQLLLFARQNLNELRIEQRIYKAALELVAELGKSETEYNFDFAQERVVNISEGVKQWPKQWRRERKLVNHPPLWKLRPESVKRIVCLSTSKRGELLGPHIDARIVLSELVNAFPSFVFPNPLEMHSYLRYGIRPLLYAILRIEFLHPRDLAICANNHCGAFFERERAGQRYCKPICSRQHRQREYWQTQGKEARRKRTKSLVKAAPHRDLPSQRLK
jgi:hypothetical protein